MISDELTRRTLPDGHMAIAGYDPNPDHPRRTRDNLGIVHILGSHRSAGDEHGFETREDFEEHQTSLPERHPGKARRLTDVHCYEHGGITLSLRPTTPAGGVVGVCFTTGERLRAHGLRSNADAERINAILESEMRELDAYVKGEIYQAKVYAVCPCCGQPAGAPALVCGSIQADSPEAALETLDADFPAAAGEGAGNVNA